MLKSGVSLREIFSVSRHALLITRKSERSINTDSIWRDARPTINPPKVPFPRDIGISTLENVTKRGTSLKKRCQEGILLVAFDEIDAKYQWVSLGVWEVHFQA